MVEWREQGLPKATEGVGGERRAGWEWMSQGGEPRRRVGMRGAENAKGGRWRRWMGVTEGFDEGGGEDERGSSFKVVDGDWTGVRRGEVEGGGREGGAKDDFLGGEPDGRQRGPVAEAKGRQRAMRLG
ncbi:hypothetical protein AMTR_s00106p00060340 [Amborella trichopoda]|uniref:Uncharacterized protein n=1 Tax=Amborella trichopoda TaxID=13333 RepID=W1NTE1_AMBTC|nr:hypothetical protein AMTR_s00106p00060340 [Amborella trichopoda]